MCARFYFHCEVHILWPQQKNVLEVVGFQTRPIRQHCNTVMQMVVLCSAEHPWTFSAGKRKNAGAARRK